MFDTEMEDLTARICWQLVKKEGYIAIWQKPLNNSCYFSRDSGIQPALCDADDDLNSVWYLQEPLGNCSIVVQSLIKKQFKFHVIPPSLLYWSSAYSSFFLFFLSFALLDVFKINFVSIRGLSAGM